MAHMSQRFCLRWNNHQANLLSVFDQLLHDESFVDVTLAVDGQYLRAHKMVLSACSPYFQALFVSHPENHPIVILNDVPFADMRCLLDFMYRGEVSVDQDRLTAFLKVAESLRIKGLTEVNEEKCDLPSIASSLLSGNGGSEGGSSGGDGSSATHHQNQHVQSHHHHQHHHKNQHQHHHHYQQQQQMQQLTQPNLSGSQPPPPPSLHRIQLSQPLSTSSLSLSPSLVGAGTSNNSRSNNNNNNNSNNNNNAATKLHIPSPSSGNNTSVNQYFSSLSTLNQRRKRGRPRKLSGSSDTPSTASPEHDMNTDYDSRASDYGHAPPDLLEVDMRESQHSPICDEQILASPNRGKNTSRDVSSDDCPYIKSEPSDDIAAASTTSSFQESDSSPRLKEGSVSRPQSRTSANNQSDRYPPDLPLLRMVPELTTSNSGGKRIAGEEFGGDCDDDDDTHDDDNNNNNGANCASAKGSNYSSNTISVSNNSTNSNNCTNGKTSSSKNNSNSTKNSKYNQDGDCTVDDGENSSLANSQNNNAAAAAAVFLLNNTSQHHFMLNSGDVKFLSTNNGRLQQQPPQQQSSAESTGNSAKISTTSSNNSTSVNSSTTTTSPKTTTAVTATRRRVRRRTTSSSDPAEQLTEMSVRGLNLFRYACIDDGVYKCLECAKSDIVKTFKNKYSFQRHAFLYHEGCQRKVFPCLVCSKEFSRPDKMKNHMKTVHDCFMPKECAVPKECPFPPPPAIPFFLSPP